MSATTPPDKFATHDSQFIQAEEDPSGTGLDLGLATKKPSFFRRNIAYIVGGPLVVLLLVVAAIGMFGQPAGGPSPVMTRPNYARPQPASQPSQPLVPAPGAPAAAPAAGPALVPADHAPASHGGQVGVPAPHQRPLEGQGLPAPGSAQPPAAPAAPLGGQHGIQPGAQAQLATPAPTIAQATVPSRPSTPAPQQAPPGYPNMVLAPTPASGPQGLPSASATAQIEGARAREELLQKQVAQLEREKAALADQLQAVQTQGVPKASTPKATPVKVARVAKGQPKAKRVAVQKTSARAPASAPSATGATSAAVARNEASSNSEYRLRGAANGIAWISTTSGELVAVSEGDVVPGLGRVGKIDEAQQYVQIGARVLR